MATLPGTGTDCSCSGCDCTVQLRSERVRSNADNDGGRNMAGKHEDATLIVELAKWGSMIGLPEASRTIFSDDGSRDSAEALDPHIQTVLVFHETVGTLVKNDLLDRDLVLDWLWVSGAWDRVGTAALESRAAAGESLLWENFETLAQSQA